MESRLPKWDSIPAGAEGGFDDRAAVPPGNRVVASARLWPSADAVVTAMLSFLGIGENPPGSKGDDVRTFQIRLAERGWDIPVDGVYGRDLQWIVDQFQHEKHLDNDGIVGPRTWEAAWRAPVT